MFNLIEVIPYFRTRTSAVPLTGGQPTKLCAADPTRAIVYFNGHGYNNCWLSNPPILYTNWGPFVLGVDNTVGFTWLTDGPMPTLEWWAVPTAPFSTPTVLVTEVLWQPPGDL